MLWHKAWLDTRSRFLIGLAILTVIAVGVIFDYSATQRLLPLLMARDPAAPPDSELARMVREAAEIQRTYRGFVWYRAFRDNLLNLGILFAVLLGCGGLLAEAAKGSALFTLSLPVSRRELFGIRTATGIGQCFLLAMIPPLVIPLASPAIGQQYSFVDALAHGFCLFVVGAMFFSFACLLSTVFSDVWRPLLISCAAAVGIGIAEVAARASGLGVFRVMSGEAYMRNGTLPWIGLAASAMVAAALLYLAALNNERQEF